MKTGFYLSLAIAAGSAFAVINLSATPLKPVQGGTDILHFSVRKNLTNEGVATNATGWVTAMQNQQGHANNQRLDIVASKLETNTTYQLYALVGTNTAPTHVTDFNSGPRGKAMLRYMKVGSSKGQGAGKGKLSLPAEIDPICNIREMAITDVNTQAVLTADLTSPDKLVYLIKRSLVAGNVTASLRLFATTNAVQFRLSTRGLTPSSNYSLAADGVVVDTRTSNTNGFLLFTNLPVVPAQILDLHTLAVLDSTSTSVISTQLP